MWMVTNVAIGDRIRRLRNLRGMTQKELGLAVGFSEATADVRVAQYESGTRTPKKDMINRLSEALDVSYRAIYESTMYEAEDLMYTLFELDEHYPIRLYESIDISNPYSPERHVGINFRSAALNEYIKEWQQRKKELDDGLITESEYMEWKWGWPQTMDGGGIRSPAKKWRK